MGDILRVHEYHYIRRLLNIIKSLNTDPEESLYRLDPDTTISKVFHVIFLFLLHYHLYILFHFFFHFFFKHPILLFAPPPKLNRDSIYSTLCINSKQGSWEAALRAAGAPCNAVDQVMSGKSKNAFCAVRPPGHHAGPTGVHLAFLVNPPQINSNGIIIYKLRNVQFIYNHVLLLLLLLFV